MCYVAVANPSERRVKIFTNEPIAAVVHVKLVANDTSASVVESKLTQNKKLRKVPHELRVDELPDFAPDKRPLTAFVIMYFHVFAEYDAYVGTTSLAFYKINTSDTRPLQQPVRHLPYKKMRKTKWKTR